VCEEVIDVLFFVAKPTEQRKVGILCEARLTPALHCIATNEAKAPTGALAEGLKVISSSEDGIH
jgi:hypothetical protein